MHCLYVAGSQVNAEILTLSLPHALLSAMAICSKTQEGKMLAINDRIKTA